MCLYKPLQKTATKDIVCYKVFRMTHLKNMDGLVMSGNGYIDKNPFHLFILESPFYYGQVPYGCYDSDKTREPFVSVGTKEIFGSKQQNPDDVEIQGGFIHSFKHKKDAESLKSFFEGLDSTNSLYNETYVVVKCVIPKGEQYYEGSTTNGKRVDEQLPFQTTNQIEAIGYASDKVFLLGMTNFKKNFFTNEGVNPNDVFKSISEEQYAAIRKNAENV